MLSFIPYVLFFVFLIASWKLKKRLKMEGQDSHWWQQYHRKVFWHGCAAAMWSLLLPGIVWITLNEMSPTLYSRWPSLVWPYALMFAVYAYPAAVAIFFGVMIFALQNRDNTLASRVMPLPFWGLFPILAIWATVFVIAG